MFSEVFISFITMVCLAFIMIHVGLEFVVDKSNLKSYVKDYFIAFTTATFPWIFCALYFILAFDHPSGLTNHEMLSESLLISRFAAPTSAGVLFTMLTAAGLAATWVFRKARILAIFDDLDTIILMIPIKMFILGFQPTLAIHVLIMLILLWLAWSQMHRIKLPLKWHWTLFYAFIIAFVCEEIYIYSSKIEGIIMGVDIEVLLPSFVLGCCLAFPHNTLHSMEDFLHRPVEKRAKLIISAFFMFLVGLNMPPLMGLTESIDVDQVTSKLMEFPDAYFDQFSSESKIAGLSYSELIWHVFWVTLLSNLGKMFPVLCYRKESSLRERFSLAIGMCPRGEVGAGIIVVSINLVTHISNAVIAVAMLSLALNLVLTGFFILLMKYLLDKEMKEKGHLSF
ncbi:hypothetical protein N9Y92_00765 [Chlamydiales bacterium]|nr:hypothetical protein [Chlamydiales bacterium]